VDKVYSRENLKLAWERVRANRGASGADSGDVGDFEAHLDENLGHFLRELWEHRPISRKRCEDWRSERGAPGRPGPLGIPSVYDRVCQQQLANRLEPTLKRS